MASIPKAMSLMVKDMAARSKAVAAMVKTWLE
jgi:hypothetical protein